MAEKNIRQMLLHEGTRDQDLPDLNTIELICASALDDSKGASEATAAFNTIATPHNIRELVRIAKTALSDMERQELARLIEELTYYVKTVPDEKGAAGPIDRDGVILRARQLRSVIGI